MSRAIWLRAGGEGGPSQASPATSSSRYDAVTTEALEEVAPVTGVAPTPPSRYDVVAIACPLCRRPFTPVGRQKYCSDACRVAAYRRRRQTAPPPVSVPADRPRKPLTVYECDLCGQRAVGEQRCADCSTFMRKVGLGGVCPHCDEPVAVTELLGQEGQS